MVVGNVVHAAGRVRGDRNASGYILRRGFGGRPHVLPSGSSSVAIDESTERRLLRLRATDELGYKRKHTRHANLYQPSVTHPSSTQYCALSCTLRESEASTRPFVAAHRRVSTAHGGRPTQLQFRADRSHQHRWPDRHSHQLAAGRRRGHQTAGCRLHLHEPRQVPSQDASARSLYARHP